MSLPLLVEDLPGGVVAWTMDRPETHNAYDGAMIAAFRAAVADMVSDPPRAVLLRGRGRHFQAGADLTWMAAVRDGPGSTNLDASVEAAAMFRELNALACPLVALVQGACLGGGTGLVAAADVAIAASDAFFSIAEVRRGLNPGFIVPLLNDAIGVRQTRRYALTGERFTATEARRLGLVHDVVPPANLTAHGLGVLSEILHGAPGAIRTTKRHVLDSSWSAGSPQLLEHLITSHAATRVGAEAGEGTAAFADRRPPSWVSTTSLDPLQEDHQ